MLGSQRCSPDDIHHPGDTGAAGLGAIPVSHGVSGMLPAPVQFQAQNLASAAWHACKDLELQVLESSIAPGARGDSHGVMPACAG